MVLVSLFVLTKTKNKQNNAENPVTSEFLALIISLSPRVYFGKKQLIASLKFCCLLTSSKRIMLCRTTEDRASVHFQMNEQKKLKVVEEQDVVILLKKKTTWWVFFLNIDFLTY